MGREEQGVAVTTGAELVAILVGTEVEEHFGTMLVGTEVEEHFGTMEEHFAGLNVVRAIGFSRISGVAEGSAGGVSFWACTAVYEYNEKDRTAKALTQAAPCIVAKKKKKGSRSRILLPKSWKRRRCQGVIWKL